MITESNGKNVDWANMPLDKMAKGNALDAFYTLKLYEVLKVKLQDLNMLFHYENLISPLISVLGEVELRGMLIDAEKLDVLKPMMEAKVQKLEGELKKFKQVTPDDNIGAPNCIREILFEREGGFGLYPPFRTKKTDQPQADKNTLETLEAMIEEELELRK